MPPHRRIDAAGRPTVQDIADRIREERDGSGIPAVELRHTAEVIGYCGLVRREVGPDEPELAFELLRSAHGRGYATETGRAVVTWAGEAGHVRFWASVWAWNVASRRVLAKLGFHETGQMAPHQDNLLAVREL